ncbi:DUF3806 domain-containing protein [Luteipulveratus sp. YIM 133132]|uniref:DUF3806 domain-containing protein n=1 Tax=Luteipulveratus flavus TaxID=3031728 RepID=A0ABT6C529_9MICO|nr:MULTISPECIES: DUF3806 domain-containing protein [unclassified Luteipulveratus]MDE9367538.1 DUF3806 domain-containing protein [Luteipulveratus sp. YIM 133132]MDF8263397.1 DUF3806 domain-containing protein [Luteipulveratus sp. YIM 133296]
MPDEDIRISPLGDAERRTLHEWLNDARSWDIDPDDLGSIDRAYDGYVARVLATDPDDREDPTAVCTMIGLAMGEHIVRNSVLEWRVVTDAEGTDLALATPSEDAVLYPADPVIEAWADQRTSWISAWASDLIRGVREAHG